jgi:propanol-preferring alcohol dehydrogenase
MSLRVIAIDTGADKKALCASYGAETFLDFKDSGNFIDRVKAVTGGLGPHVCLSFTLPLPASTSSLRPTS